MDDDIIFQILSGKDEETKEEDEKPNEDKPDDNNSLTKVDQEVTEQQEKEINLKKNSEEKKKAVESFIPNISNPLDFVNYCEIEQSNTKISTAYSNFLIQNHRKQSKLKSVLEIEPHLEINKTIFTQKNRIIKSIYAKDDELIMCDSNGNIVFFSLKAKRKSRELIYPSKFFSSENEDRTINCVDITDEHDYLFVGYRTGTISVFDLKKLVCRYSITKIHNNKSCIELRYSHREKNVFHILSCDIDGNVSYSIIKDGALGWRLVSTDKLIENKEIPIFYLKFIRPIEYINDIPEIKNLHQTAIFGAMDSIYIYSLEPSINEITSIDKPDYIRENVVPDIQVGVGKSLINIKYTKIDEKNKLIMGISWGRTITIYELPIKDTFIKQPIVLGHYVNKDSILKIGFLSNSVLFFIDEKFTIKILNTRKIGYGNVQIIPLQKKVKIPKNNSDSELQNETLLDKNILTQDKITDPDNDEIQKDIYQYTIITNNSSIFILCKAALYFGSLIDWKDFLQKLSKKEEYLSLFSIGIDTYQGKMNALLNIPHEEENRKKLIGDYLRGEISKYAIFTTGSKKSGTFDSPEEVELIKKCMNISIELCLEIESFDYLIKNIEPMFESIEYGDYFLTKLEPFILYDKIKDVILSEEIVKEIIDLYIRKDMSEILSQLLLHLNIKCIENDNIKEKIKELNLISPLIYLYMNGSYEDYFAPINIMFQYFNKANELPNFTTYNEALESEKMKTVLNSKQYYGHKILWYLRLCLTGRKFPNNEEKMKPELYNKLIPDITYWLITEKVMNVFINFDPKDYFNILKNIFSLEFFYNKLVESANNLDIKIAITAQLLNSKFNISDIEPLTLIENIINYCRDQNNEIKNYLYDFVITSSKLNNINKKLRTETVNYILSNYGDVAKDKNNEELKSFINNIITFIDNDMFNNFDYTNFIEKIKFDIYDEVKLYLLNKTKQYQKCLELYIEPNSYINDKKNRLFKWIHETHQDVLYNEKGLNQLKSNIMSNLKKIAHINIKNFDTMVKEIFPNDQKIVLEKLLSEDKEMCLKYIETLVKAINNDLNRDDDNDDIKRDNENISFILYLHIKLLCEMKKYDEILEALEKNDLYPYERCLDLCIKNKVYDSIIYLYQVNGDLSKAVNVCLDRIDEAFKNYLSDLDNNQITNLSEIKDNYWNKIEKYLKRGIKVCEHNSQDNDDDIWFDLLGKLFQFEKQLEKYLNKYKDNEINKGLVENMQNIVIQNIKDLMEKMCSYVSIKRIINVVSERNKDAGFKEFRDLIMNILYNYSSQTNIFSSTRNLLSELIFENEGLFQTLNLEGDLIDVDKCDKCQKEFNKNFMYKEKIIIFNCKHYFHKNCTIKEKTDNGIEEFCPICRAQEVQKSSNKGKSLIKKHSVIIDKERSGNKEFQVNVSFTSQNIIKKLKKFDNKLKTKKRIAIENSLEITA